MPKSVEIKETITLTELRPELKLPLPERIKALPVHRGYPVPWFVSWIKGEPEFRVADGLKWTIAVQGRRCWVCGGKLGAYLAFVLGPMCGITHTTSEPACHRECAEWSIQNCPFLTRPHMVRRENDLPEEAQPAPGMGLKRNPGVSLLWITRDYTTFYDDKNRPLLSVGDPVEVLFYMEGRPATRAEIDASVAGGLPKLEELAELDGLRGMAALARKVREFEDLLPKE
jgi:hypothetical protein